MRDVATPRLRVLTHLPRGLLARVEADLPEVELVEIPGSGPLPEDARGEVLLTFTWGSDNMQEVLARGVRWVHCYGTGVDGFPQHALGDRTLTCSRGASAVPIAEWVLAAMLAAEKNLPDAWITAPPERWNWAKLGGLAGRTLGILGLGSIGCEVARRALAFDMRVRGLRRSAAPSPLPGVELAGDLGELVACADHLVVAAPATRETKALVGRAALAHARPGLHLVNIARGDLVDQDALREALDDGRVRLATLDVCEPEPLPEGHWLYTHPRVRLSPHISWSAPGALERLLVPFLENLRRRLAGEPLQGVVDLAAGY
jgi:phosphoglycerate dehydrogenase-like enzyme